MSGALTDQAIAEVGAKQWQLSSLDIAVRGQIDCADPILFGTFTSEARRPLPKHVRSIQVLFGLHLGIPSRGDAAELGELVAIGRRADVLQPLAFQASVPPNSKVDLLHYSLGSNQGGILKVLCLPAARRLSSGKFSLQRGCLRSGFPARALEHQESRPTPVIQSVRGFDGVLLRKIRWP